MVIDNELIAAATPLILALVGILLQYLKSKDTNKHGDAFILMLKKDSETLSNVAEVIPSIKPYVEQYKAFVAEADKIWNSGGFTAEDVKELQRQYAWWELQFNAALANYRALKAAIDKPTTGVTPPVG